MSSDADVAHQHVEALCRDAIRVAHAMTQGMEVEQGCPAFCIYDASTFEDHTMAADFILGFWIDEASACKQESVLMRVKFTSSDVPGMSQAYTMTVARSDVFVPAFRGMTIIPILALNRCSGVKIDVVGEVECSIHVLCAFVTDPHVRRAIITSSTFCAAYGTRPSTHLCRRGATLAGPGPCDTAVLRMRMHMRMSHDGHENGNDQVCDRTMRFPFSRTHDVQGDGDDPDPVPRALLVLPDMHAAIDRVMCEPAARQRAKYRHDAVFHELVRYCWHPGRMGWLAPWECEIETIA